MTVKNLYLGIKDQLPWSRLWKNIRNGHVFGLFSKRSHLNASGIPKISYGSKATAIKSAEVMARKHEVHFSNYKCIFCDGYHIGKNRANKKD